MPPYFDLSTKSWSHRKGETYASDDEVVFILNGLTFKSLDRRGRRSGDGRHESDGVCEDVAHLDLLQRETGAETGATICLVTQCQLQLLQLD